MICFSRAEQLHDASLSFTFSAYSCQLTQQHEATKSVRDLLQLCRLLQWWHYKGLHRQYQKRKNMELTSHETASWWWPQTPIFDHNISYSPMATRPQQTNSLSKAPWFETRQISLHYFEVYHSCHFQNLYLFSFFFFFTQKQKFQKTSNITVCNSAIYRLTVNFS